MPWEKPCHSSSGERLRAVRERQEAELQVLPFSSLHVKHCATKHFPGVLSVQPSGRGRRVLRMSALPATSEFKQ